MYECLCDMYVSPIGVPAYVHVVKKFQPKIHAYFLCILQTTFKPSCHYERQNMLTTTPCKCSYLKGQNLQQKKITSFSKNSAIVSIAKTVCSVISKEKIGKKLEKVFLSRLVSSS